MAERPIRTRPAWRVLRAVWDLADGAWIWRGSYEHIVQLARVPRDQVAAHLRALAAEKVLTIALRPRLGRVVASWPPGSAREMMRLLTRIQPGDHRFPRASRPCQEPDCELEAGHEYMHFAATHPVLRLGEVMRWESPAPLVGVPIEAPPVPTNDDLTVGERLMRECCPEFAVLGAVSAPVNGSIVAIAPADEPHQ